MWARACIDDIECSFGRATFAKFNSLVRSAFDARPVQLGTIPSIKINLYFVFFGNYYLVFLLPLSRLLMLEAEMFFFFFHFFYAIGHQIAPDPRQKSRRTIEPFLPQFVVFENLFSVRPVIFCISFYFLSSFVSCRCVRESEECLCEIFHA